MIRKIRYPLNKLLRKFYIIKINEHKLTFDKYNHNINMFKKFIKWLFTLTKYLKNI